jgi:hypothetical protein
MRRASLVLVLAALTGFSADARAADWASFAAAFPSFPCQDGWMACLTGAGPVDPDLRDGALAGQRVGWFDLQATSQFSPFVEFSKYDKVGGAEPVAAADPEPAQPSIDDAYADVEDTPETKAAKEEARRTDVEAAEARKSNDEAKAAAAEAEAQRREAEAEARRQREAEAAARREAEELSRKAAAAASQAQAAERAQLEKEAADAKRRADEAEKQRKAADAAAAAKAKAEDDARRKAAEEEKKRAAAEQAKATADAAARVKLEAERTRQDEERRKQEDAQRAKQEEERRKQEQAAQAAAMGEAQAAQQAAAAAAAEAAALKKQRDDAEKARIAAEAKAAGAADAEAKKAAAAEAARMEAESRRLAEEQKAAEAKRQAEEAKQAEAKRKAEEEARIAEERRAATERADAERKAAEAKKAEEQKRAAEEAARKLAAAQQGGGTEPPPEGGGGGGGDGTCDLLGLEPAATLGKLSGDQIQSCESALSSAAKMTDKKKYSVLLQNNAWSKGDKADWERLVKRHLEEIDESDPDMAFRYALHLGKLGPGRATGAIKYADVALENRSVWTGDTYTSRVYSLYKVKVVAAQSLWKAAEEAHTAAPTDETRKKADDRRNTTKVFAREWYEYAKSIGRDTSDALQVCTSAAGTADYCQN